MKNKHLIMMVTLALFIPYSFTAYGIAEINPIKWSIETRGFQIMETIILLIISVAIWDCNKPKKQ